MIAGGIAPLVGALLLSVTSNSWWPLAVYVFVLAAITFVTTFFCPETRGRDLQLLDDAVQDTAVQVGARPAPQGGPAKTS